MFKGLHGHQLEAQTLTGNHSDRESLPYCAGGHFHRDEGFWTHDEKAKCMEWGASRITQTSPGQLLGRRELPLVRAFEYTNFKPVAVHTLFCWQRVFLLSVSLLQFRLVKGCDLCNVWFVTHVCRRSSKESPQLELQEVMRTWEEVTARVGEVTTFAGWVRLIYFLHLKIKQQARLPPFLKCVRM